MSINKFSSTLKLGDFDDYITPSQECIKPINIKKPTNSQSTATVAIKGKTLKKVEITLNDCLACSGCITSAETLLVTSQSHQQFLKVVKEIEVDNHKKIIISVSPQVQASLAVHYQLKSNEINIALNNYFKLKHNVLHILDTSFAQQFALIESSREFIENYNLGKETANKLPIMTSACPGWICYVEKTHGKLLIPHLSTVKSAQQITGTLVKRLVSKYYNLTSPSDVYHVTLMPCYDKKLEASREDFYDDLYSTRDVDLVLTSSEIVEMLNENNENLRDFLHIKDDLPNHSLNNSESCESAHLLLETAALTNTLTTRNTSENETTETNMPESNTTETTISANTGSGSTNTGSSLMNAGSSSMNAGSSSMNAGSSSMNTGSGGYLEFVMKSAAKKLFDIEIDEIQYQPVRNNQDFQEAKLKNEKGEILLNFALAYGFRSIQNLVQKMKRKKCHYDYIEVMACPSGCLNGGGQAKSANGGKEEQKQILDQVMELYNKINTNSQHSIMTSQLLRHDASLDDKCYDIIEDKEKDLMTGYHAIEKSENISVKW